MRGFCISGAAILTVSSQTSVVQYTGNGSTVAWPTGFRFFKNADLVVAKRSVAGVTTVLTLNTDYSVSGANALGGGTITTTNALATGELLTIARVLTVQQLTDLRNQGDYFAEIHEDVFDYLTMLIQQVNEGDSRALKHPRDYEHYQAEARRIENLEDPVNAQDATTKNWVSTFIGGLLAAIQGPINNALNIFYRAPDLTAHVVQDLSGSAGATLIGDGSGTVKDSLNALSAKDTDLLATIQANDLKADSGYFGNNDMLSRIRQKVGTGQFMYILGDSISHGAFAGDCYRNSWVNVFKRMLNTELGTYSYGYVPINALFDAGSVKSVDVADIEATNTAGTLNPWVALDSSTAPYLAQGYSLVSTLANSVLRCTCATFQDTVGIHYVQQPGGGSFQIKRNGVVQSTISTDGPFKATAYTPIPMTDNGLGTCVIEAVTVSAARTELTGFSFFSAEDQNVLQNFSQSGRKLRNLAENTIIEMLQACPLLIVALGVNDVGENEISSANYTDFVQRINWLIQYAKLYEVPVVVPDFIWYYPASNKTRQQLKRLALETQGTYIPFPDYFKKGVINVDQPYLVDTLKLFNNALHPNISGHKYIAETIAKKIGLSVTSKRQALDYHDWWFPIPLLTGTGITNLGTTSRTVSATKIQGGDVLFRMALTGTTGVSVTKQIAGPLSTRSGATFQMIETTPLQPKTTGVSRGTMAVSNTLINVTLSADNEAATNSFTTRMARTYNPNTW